jgi:hypothetical protein
VSISKMASIKAQIEDLFAKIDADFLALQSEIANLKTEISNLKAQIVIKDAEIERLKKLLNTTPTPTPTPSVTPSKSATPVPTVTPTPSKSATPATTPTSTPVNTTPSIDYSISVKILDVPARPGQRTIGVPVVLSKPADRTMVLNYSTKNGAGTWNDAWEPVSTGGGNYIGNVGQIWFHPGESVKIINVRLLTDLTAAQNIVVYLSDYKGWPNHNYADQEALIKGDPAGTMPYPSLPTNASKVPVRPILTKVFDDDMTTNFSATDSGLKSDGVTKTWRSRLIHGRTQPGNQEIGYYADPVLNPGTNPFPIDAATGSRIIQAEYISSGVKDQAGNILTYDYGSGRKNFVHTAAMLHSHTYFQVELGGFVEARIKMDAVPGTWPAFWLLPEDYSWPALEIDIFEGFYYANQTPDKNTLATTVHWKDTSGNHIMWPASYPLDRMLNKPAFSVSEWHIYGAYVTNSLITCYVDDVPVFSMPNMTDRSKKMSVLLNVATGGMVQSPTDNSKFPARMWVDWVRGYK